MLRGINIWGAGWLKAWMRRPRLASLNDRCHVFVAIADHFEPVRDNVTPAVARELVRDWLQDYRKNLAQFPDADGRPPQHTFFFPGDAYDRDCVEKLAMFCGEGWGETEIHLHHRNDTAAAMEQKLADYKDLLHREHGLLGVDEAGAIRYGFVHGNWSLCNSRPDGDWCGVNSELTVLHRTGCYADFTFPSAPSPTQPRTVNTIYRAVDDADGAPRGHDYGIPAGKADKPVAPGSVLMVPGPLTIDWHRRKWGLLPRLENAELSGLNPPSPQRLKSWLAPWIHVPDRPEWVFVKLHTHGCAAANRPVISGAESQAWHRDLAAYFADPRRGKLHYVTAREMFNLIRAAECGAEGEPAPWRDFEISPPPSSKSGKLKVES